MYNIKDLNYRKSFSKYELTNKFIKFINYNRLIQNEKFCFTKPKTSKVRIINSCIFTSRNRSIYRKLKISRLQLKSLTKLKKIHGIKKASW